jgi:hypothetical protein
MRRVAIAIMALLFAANAAPVGAGEFWHRYVKDYLRTRAWPQPFVKQDRAAVRAPWVVMAHNGWRAQNTLTGHLFDLTGNLTEAGRRKIHWIATQVPVERRTVYVLTSSSQEQTQTRTRAVQDYIALLARNGIASPELMLTDREPLRWSGDYYDRVEKAGREAIAAPVLPEMQLTTDGG